MSRFLILSTEGDGTGLALRLKAEGHSAKFWIRDSISKDYGKGLVDCSCEYEFGQTVVADCTGFGPLIDLIRDSDIKTFGGSSFADHLEEDRELSEQIMQDAGIDTPESKSASSWEEASKFVDALAKKSNDGKVVIKPEGDLSGTVPSYVAANAEDAKTMLRSFEQQTGATKPELTIQEFIEGVAVSTEGWFNGEDWVDGMFNHTIENKKTLNDDLGPSHGCSGNVVWACDSKDPLVKQTLTKLTKVLREARYVGPIDINCVVNEEDVYGLEFTPRFGYDAFPTLLYSLCDFDFGDFIELLSRGGMAEVHLKKGFACGVRLTIPKNEKNKTSTDIRGFTEDDLQWFYPYAVQFDEETGLRTTKGGCVPGVVNGYGDTIDEAFARAYEICSRLQIRDLQYRSDLCEACLKDFRELRGIITGDKGDWVGVDLDGTLAKYSGWSEDIGEPIPKMVQRVKGWLSNGTDVRVLTARGSQEPGRYEQLIKVHEWVKKHIGTPLEVTSKKDPLMVRLYDDRVRQVEEGTGVLV